VNEIYQIKEEIASYRQIKKKSVWWWAPWTLTEPWRVYAFRGGDEFDRRTLAIHLGPLGCLIIADPRDGGLDEPLAVKELQEELRDLYLQRQL
jgi:hypothetical protein